MLEPQQAYRDTGPRVEIVMRAKERGLTFLRWDTGFNLVSGPPWQQRISLNSSILCSGATDAALAPRLACRTGHGSLSANPSRRDPSDRRRSPGKA